MKCYNPFDKIPTLSEHELMYRTEHINSRVYNVAEINIDRKLEFVEVMNVFKKLNHYFILLNALVKSNEKGENIDGLNNKYRYFMSKFMDIYTINFPTTAIIPTYNERKNKQMKKLYSEVPRFIRIFTKSKDRKDLKTPMHFFRVDKNKKMDIYKEIDMVKNNVNHLKKKCAKLFMDNGIKKSDGIYQLVNVFSSYLHNLDGIKNAVKRFEDRGIYLTFDIAAINNDNSSMIYDTLDFLFVRKWIAYSNKRRFNKRRK